MLLDEKEQPRLSSPSPTSPVVSLTSVPSAPPPSYSDSLPPSSASNLPLAHVPPLPSVLLLASRSSHYSHCTTGPASIYHTHVFDLARPIPETLLPKADRPEATLENGQRVNGLFWSERGEVKVVAGVLRGGTGSREVAGTKKRRVRLVFGSEAEREGEGEVDVKILTRHPPTLPISISLTSTSGPLRLLLPRNFRGHLTHIFQPSSSVSSSSSYSPSSPLILSPEIQAVYTPLSNAQGFIGSFEGGAEDASLDGLDEAFLSTGGTRITVGFAEDDQQTSSDVDTKQDVIEESAPTNEQRSLISSALNSLASSLESKPIFSPYWPHLWASFLGPFFLGILLLLLLISTSFSTLYLLRHGPSETLHHLQGLKKNWRELSETIISASLLLGGVLVFGGLGWSSWWVARSLGWEGKAVVPEEVEFVGKRLLGGWWEEERGWGGVQL